MLEWLLIVMCVITLALVGCKGVDRLTGTGPEEEKVTITNKTEHTIYLEFGGVFTNDNFVSLPKVPKEKYDNIDVIIIRKGKKIAVNPYTKKADNEGHPYYVVSQTGGLIFLNHQYGDEYQILVLK